MGQPRPWARATADLRASGPVSPHSQGLGEAQGKGTLCRAPPQGASCSEC